MRSPGESAAVSISTMAGSSRSLTIRQRTSPWRPGRSPVQHEHVVGIEIDLGGRLQTVVGDVHGHTLVAQALGDVVG